MPFMSWIIERLNDASDFFYSIYLEVQGWVYPFWQAASIFYELCLVFNHLAWDFYYFNEWVYEVSEKITTFLTSLDLEAWFNEWKQKILDAWYWITNAWSNVFNIIDEWWLTVQSTIRSWIDIAVEGLDSLKVAWSNFWTVTFPEWTGKLDTLKAAWDNFWTVTFPSLVSFSWLDTWWSDRLKELDKLINDTIVVWFPFYDDLVSLWEDIKLFFTDPLTWLESKFTEWFLGKE